MVIMSQECLGTRTCAKEKIQRKFLETIQLHLRSGGQKIFHSLGSYHSKHRKLFVWNWIKAGKRIDVYSIHCIPS